MVSNEVNAGNSSTSGSDEILGSNSVVTPNSMVLLVRVKHVDGQPIEPGIFTETLSGSFVHLLTQYTFPMQWEYLVHMKLV